MATKEEIERSLILDDAYRARKALGPAGRRPRYQDNGLEESVEEFTEEELNDLDALLTPKSLID